MLLDYMGWACSMDNTNTKVIENSLSANPREKTGFKNYGYKQDNIK
jgi:hypothetical protein